MQEEHSFFFWVLPFQNYLNEEAVLEMLYYIFIHTIQFMSGLYISNSVLIKEHFQKRKKKELLDNLQMVRIYL